MKSAFISNFARTPNSRTKSCRQNIGPTFQNYSDEVGTILDFPYKEEIKDGITPPKIPNLFEIWFGGPSGGFCFAKSGFIKIFCVLFLPLTISLSAYSGENLEGTMRAQQQRQQQLMQQAAAQQIAQQKAAIIQQQQRMIQERQQALQQQAAYQQALQQQQVIQQQRAVQNQAYSQAYQQKVAQEIARKQTVQHLAYEQAVQQRNQQASYVQSAKEQLLASQEAFQAGAAQYSQPAYHPSVEADQVSDLEHIWKDLEISTEIWPMMMDREPKELTIKRFIEAYRKNGITIRKPASGYVDIIDSMTSEPNSPMLKTPFKDVLKVAAIIEYDFDNGLDKDQMALKVLGEKSFESNKKRLGR